MKILQVIVPGPMAGAEKSVLASTLGMRELGYDPLLLVVRERRKPQCADDFINDAKKCGLRTKSLDARGRIDPLFWIQLRDLLAGGGFDIVHAHGYKALTYLVSLKGHTSGLAATYHGATSHTTLSKWFEKIERLLFEKVDRLFVVSQASLSTLRKQGLKTDRVVVVPNMLPRSFATLLSKRKPHGDAWLKLLFLGRLSKEKGLDVLIAALESLPELPFRLKVVGDGPERTTISDQILRVGLDDKISLEGFQSDVISYLLDADALIMPSRTEGLPMSLIEAAVTGLPVIASQVGGIPEVITHDKNGLLVNPDRPDQLAEAIAKLHQGLDRYRKTCKKTAVEMQKRYCSAACCEKILAEYKQLLDQKSRTSITS